MKSKTELISARLRVYGKNSTKISDNCQVQLEIRNFTDKPLRISAKDSNLKLLHLKTQHMKKGLCVGRADTNLINARLNKLKEQLRYVMQFLQYSKIPINKPTVEDFLYRRYTDVYSFFTEVTDAEDAELFFKYLNKSAEENQRETLENHKFLASIGEYKATGFMEGLNLHNFETCRKETIIPNFTKWCKSIGIIDYPIIKFNRKVFDSFTRFMIDQPRKRTKAGKEEYYSVKTIDNMIKEVRIYLKALKEIDYTIDDSALEFKLVKGNRRNAHIKFINNEKDNVFSITAAELNKVRNSVNDNKLPEKLRRAATLFTLQTLLGGLRVSELNLITKDSFKLVNDRYYCFITTKKTKKMIDSPLHSELLPILEKINFNIDALKFRTDIEYNTALRELAQKLELKRDIVQLDSRANANTQEIKTEKLYNLFTTRLARKAAITLLFATGKYSLEQIAKMTKHSLTAIQYYVAVLNDEKAEMMGSL
jgi:integrase